MLGWGRGSNSLRVDRDSLVADISNISVVVVRGVLDSLGTAIRESNRVLTRDNTVSVSSLSSIEPGVGVVISNAILVSVGLLNLRVGRGRVGNDRGSMSNNWGRVGNNRGGMSNNWGTVSNNWGMMGNNRGSMSQNRSSMSQNWSMSNRSMRHYSTMSRDHSMGGYKWFGGSSSHTNKGSDHESLHFCSIVV